MNILSFNLRVHTKVDGIHAWPNRKKEAIAFMKDGCFDVIGLQEVTYDMYDDLKDALQDYHFIYRPRDNDGESAPLLVKKEMFEILESQTFWLTDTPFTESKIEGSAFKRTASYAVLKTKENEIITVFNTHLDYQNGETIYHQATYLYEMMKKVEDAYQASLILTGDFNQHPNDLAIRFLSSYLESCYQNEQDFGLTFHGFTELKEGLPIDYIFFSQDISIENFMIHHHKSNIFMSDHYPISLSIKK